MRDGLDCLSPWLAITFLALQAASRVGSRTGRKLRKGETVAVGPNVVDRMEIIDEPREQWRRDET